jgi:hypothetical protein
MTDRRKGVGALLYRQFEQLAQSHDCNLICLEVHMHNSNGQAFWRSQGFKDCGIVNDPEYSEWVKQAGPAEEWDLDSGCRAAMKQKKPQLFKLGLQTNSVVNLDL